MKITIAKHSGMCHGVKRALILLDKEIENSDYDICTLGPIIHNDQVVDLYKSKGVKVLEKVRDAKEGKVVIRSHGTTKSDYDYLKAKEITIVDATCIDVKKIQQKVLEYYEQGYDIIILGNKDHPEVVGVNGWCDESAVIIEKMEGIPWEKFENNEKKYCLVSQTTFNSKEFEKIVDELAKKLLNINVCKTICPATEKRQQSARDLSSKIDIMIVAGSKHSSNTKKLYDICRENCDKTYHIESKNELMQLIIGEDDHVGIVAGASTPNWFVDDIIIDIKKKMKARY